MKTSKYIGRKVIVTATKKQLLKIGIQAIPHGTKGEIINDVKYSPSLGIKFKREGNLGLRWWLKKSMLSYTNGKKVL